jgi:glyoxylase-like metal-dependent hydrolase (beta-lactamase superfamily II)
MPSAEVYVAHCRMSEINRKRELGRGERVVPGLWRLRLPLPWAGIPHCNAWAIASGPGIVLVDTGMHQPGSLAQLERALDQVNLRLEHVRLIACTHAHSDHWGQAAPVRDRAGCEFWMHPNHAHATANAGDSEAVLSRRLEVGRQSGVPPKTLQEYLERHSADPSGIARVIEPDKPLVEGVKIASDLGEWDVYETPGHAPSHVCLFQPEHRILISGDHVLGRISLFLEYGWSPDPVGEFLSSLDKVDRLDARLALSGHGRPFTDVHAHIEAYRALVAQRLAAISEALQGGPHTALDLARTVYEQPLGDGNAAWLLAETLCFLRHLELQNRIVKELDGEVEIWRLA